MAISSVLDLKGKALQEINIKANRIAFYVCIPNGSIPVIPETYLAEL